jgi:predicted nucleic acid-binding Zn ribbon protein
MRSFRCYDCGYQFQVAHGVWGPGSQMTCAKCGGRNIHRAESDRGFVRAGRGRGPSSLGRGRGGLGRGPRWVCQ